MTTATEDLQAAQALIDSALSKIATSPAPGPIPPEQNDELVIASFGPVAVTGISENTQPFAFDCAAQDFILYGKAQLSGLAGEAAIISLENAGRTRQIQVAVGYNFGAGSAQVGRVSLQTKASGGTFTHAGVGGVESVTQFAEFAIHLDCDRAALNLWVRGSDRWVWSGSCSAPRFSITQIRFLTRNGATAPSGQSVAFADIAICRPWAVSIGDSICAGHNAFDPSPGYYSGTDNGLSQWQAHCWPFPTRRNTIIVNKGIGGQDSAQLLARISEATKHGNLVAIVPCSTNDYGSGLTQSQRTANIQAKVSAGVDAGCVVVLLGAIYPNNNAPATAYYKQWKDTELQNITGHSLYIEIMDAVADQATGNISDNLADSDGVHPNAAGYTLIGQHIAASIQAI